MKDNNEIIRDYIEEAVVEAVDNAIQPQETSNRKKRIILGLEENNDETKNEENITVHNINEK